MFSSPLSITNTYISALCGFRIILIIFSSPCRRVFGSIPDRSLFVYLVRLTVFTKPSLYPYSYLRILIYMSPLFPLSHLMNWLKTLL